MSHIFLCKAETTQTKSMPDAHTNTELDGCIHHQAKAFDSVCVRGIGGPGGDGVSV